VDGRQTDISGSNAVIATLLNIFEEGTDKIRGKIFQR